MFSNFRDPGAGVMPVGPYKVYAQAMRGHYDSDVRMHIFQNGCVFLHVGEACISLRRSQANELLRDARGLWVKKGGGSVPAWHGGRYAQST